MVLPADSWLRSSVTVESLRRLVDDGLLHPNVTRERHEWLAPLSRHREPDPPAGYVVSFLSFHERGLRMPPSRFVRGLTHHYGVELHHFSPNSIS